VTAAEASRTNVTGRRLPTLPARQIWFDPLFLHLLPCDRNIASDRIRAFALRCTAARVH
jgi:hypothetical protein